jgi:protein-S-isoprenylcysteine O-methyltransferase Ste14
MKSLELKLPPVAAFGIVAVLSWALARQVPGPSFTPAWRIWLALALLALAAFIGLSGVRAFRQARTTVSPLSPERASSLVATGIYRHTRNPMYLALTLSLLAWAVQLGSLWGLLAVAVLPAWLTRFQIIPEERALAARFGAEFEAYCRRVRRWI